LIYSENLLEHTEYVCKVLLQLCKAGLQTDIKKCEFNVICTKYLGFVISTDSIKVDLEKIETIHNWKHPTTVRGIQSFLGFCNFYRRFIQDYDKIVALLTQLTQKEYVFDFNLDCIQMFKKLYTTLIKALLLTHFDIDKHCLLETNTSDTVIAAVFSQLGLDSE
jgi:hypothetical protein